MDEQNKKNLIEESASIPLDELINMLKATDYEFKLRHLFRLSGLEDDELGQLKAVWPSLDAGRRRSLLEDMEDLADSNTLADFETIYTIGIQDADAEIRLIATRGLLESETPGVISPLINLLDNDDALSVRIQAANTLSQFIYLGELGKLTVPRYQALFKALHTIVLADDQPVALQQACVSSLGYISNETVEAIIDNAYHLDDPDWIAASLIAMGRSADARWKQIVLEELENDEADVRLEAVQAAGQLALEEATKILITYLQETNLDIRHAAIWSLAEVGTNESLRALEIMLADNEDVQENELINDAIEHLNFSEELQDFSLFDLPDDKGDGE